MLTVTSLTNAEYLLGSVALGIDEYYMGVGEAPGVWMGPRPSNTPDQPRNTNPNSVSASNFSIQPAGVSDPGRAQDVGTAHAVNSPRAA